MMAWKFRSMPKEMQALVRRVQAAEAEAEGLSLPTPKKRRARASSSQPHDVPRVKQTRLEQRYQRYLENEQRAGRVVAWRFEPIRLILVPGQRCSYTPDFWVRVAGATSAADRLELVEVKPLDKDSRGDGRPLFVYEDSRIKVKTSAELFRWTPWTFVVVWPLRSGGWGREVL